MSFSSEELYAALSGLTQSSVDEYLEARFSQVYPPFDPRLHSQAVLRDELAKDTPLNATPFFRAASSNCVRAPSVDVTEGAAAMDEDTHSVEQYAGTHDAINDKNNNHNEQSNLLVEESSHPDDGISRTVPAQTDTYASVASWVRHATAMSASTEGITSESSMVELRPYAQSTSNFGMATERATSDTGSEDDHRVLPNGSINFDPASDYVHSSETATGPVLFKRRRSERIRGRLSPNYYKV
ncbi:hypothetical protein BDV59DRAFT_199396 [Aspergillus ambiguus]|uniref:uncharacterized protein n=1 Tax=Aspergillus ambiguus TaxID=176160 RepID=UPI003CCE158C